MLAASWPGEEIDNGFATAVPPWHRLRVQHGDAPPPRSRKSARPVTDGSALTRLYQAHTDAVRRHLQAFGARGHDIDDLAQEVFLVLHAKRELIRRIRPLDPWLREICRRVAAGERRRAHRRHEVAYGEPLETADETTDTDTALEREERQVRLHHALTQLDEHSRDLVALHELGDLPLVDVAELVEADRKTVRKRLGSALRRLTVILGSEGSKADLHALRQRRSPIGEPARSSGAFRVLARHPAVHVGLVGSVLIAVWPGAATLEALELLGEQMDRASEICGGSFAFFAVVEASTRPPDLPARRKLVAMLEGHQLAIYAAALEGGAAWLVRPIMTGLAFLARPRFAMQYFDGVGPAVRWLVQKHPRLTMTDEATLIESVQQLRL
jgi:RNA polymerase sigma factor (sigma-70 family)